MMKKLVLTLLTTFAVFSQAQAQNCNKEKSETVLAASLHYNNLFETEKILKSGCITKNDRALNIIVNQAQTVESVMLVEKYMPSVKYHNLKGNGNVDWLSALLLKEITTQKNPKKIIEEEKEIQSFLGKNIPANNFNYQFKPTITDANKLLNYVGKKYKEEYTFLPDNYGYNALVYILAANRADLINYVYKDYDSKKIFITPTKSKFAPIHFLFSPLLKGKNTSQLSDKILRDIPVSYFINTPQLKIMDSRIYDFFQFAELMKDNNPDFYRKLKAKYKFETKSVYDTPEVRKFINSNLDLHQVEN